MEVNVERFRVEVAPFLGDWKSIDLKVIASRLGDKWIYGTVKAVLDSSDPTSPTRQDLPSLDGLLIAHERWDIRRLEDLLTSLSSGELQIQGRTIIVENANTNPKMNYTFERSTRRDSNQRLGIGSYALYLQSWGGTAMLEGN